MSSTRSTSVTPVLEAVILSGHEPQHDPSGVGRSSKLSLAGDMAVDFCLVDNINQVVLCVCLGRELGRGEIIECGSTRPC